MTLYSLLLDQAQRHALPAAVLTVFVISIAYVRTPRAKAFIYSLPVPFSCAYLATGLSVNATHLSGLLLVVGYNWLVYLLTRAKLPLIAAIILSAAAYFFAAMALRPLVAVSLWYLAAAGLIGWLVALATYRPRPEPTHRSHAAWYVKAPLIFTIAMVIYNTTGLLAGGVGLFPYAGVFASYESRHSLRTLAGQFSLNALGLLACLLTIHLAEGRIPAPLPLALGWLPMLAWTALVKWLNLGKPPADTPDPHA